MGAGVAAGRVVRTTLPDGPARACCSPPSSITTLGHCRRAPAAPPTSPTHTQVLGVHTRRMPLAHDVDLAALARDTAGFTGAHVHVQTLAQPRCARARRWVRLCGAACLSAGSRRRVRPEGRCLCFEARHALAPTKQKLARTQACGAARTCFDTNDDLRARVHSQVPSSPTCAARRRWPRCARAWRTRLRWRAATLRPRGARCARPRWAATRWRRTRRGAGGC